MQSTGELFDTAGELIGTGYSGKGEGLNNPAMENVMDVGPLPAGGYTIKAPINTVKHGPYFLPLVPDSGNEMYDREDFGIHGDEILHPNQHLASEGCLIQVRIVRERIWDSVDHRLQVVPRIQAVQSA